MCGRFTLTRPTAQINSLFDPIEISSDDPLAPRFNIAPTQKILAARHKPNSTSRELVSLRWGLIPSWTENMHAMNLMNARCETMAEKPSFREAFRKRRCLIPADGFFEWKLEDGRKRPHWIHRSDGKPFAFAGLWETWKDDHNQLLSSCTVVTTAANRLLRPLHERMPVIVPTEWHDAWLDLQNSTTDFAELFRPAPEDWLILRPVSNAVNSAQKDSPECIEPFAPQERQLSLWDE